MTVTTPSAAVKGSRSFVLSFNNPQAQTFGANTTIAFCGITAGGPSLGHPWRVTQLTVSGNVSNASNDGTFTFTVYNGAVGAGNRALETTLTLTSISERSSTTTTPTNVGKDQFAATDQLVVRGVFTFVGDNAIIDSLSVLVFGEWAD